MESLVFLEVTADMPSLTKNTALLLFCCFRQAERSIHYAQSCPNQWPQFVAYYERAKQSQIAAVIGLLKDASAGETSVSSRHDLGQSGLRSVGQLLAAFLCNPLKRAWSFSVQELCFFSAKLEHLLSVLDDSERRANKELIELRLDLFQCHYIISRKLVGLSEIRKADAIEHFNQSEYVTHVTFADIGVRFP